MSAITDRYMNSGSPEPLTNIAMSAVATENNSKHLLEAKENGKQSKTESMVSSKIYNKKE